MVFEKKWHMQASYGFFDGFDLIHHMKISIAG